MPIRPSSFSWNGRLGARKHDSGLTAALVSAVQKFYGAAMGFGDLPREHQADSAAGGLGGVEGDEHVRGIAQPGAVVFDGEDEIFLGQFPAYIDHRRAGRGDRSSVMSGSRTLGFHRRFDRVAHQDRKSVV